MQAKTLNIPSYIDDPSYRYKMPGLLLKIEGRGNGIKTKIVNLSEIATALRVPPAYALKFLGYELGSQTNETQSVINGSFQEPELRKHLDKFIEKYVLCSNCKYPEMVLKIKHNAVGGSCNSCGTKSTLDNAHKLAPFILKNPPTNSSEFKDKDPKDKVKDDKEKTKTEKDKGKEEKEVKKSKHGDKDHHEKKPEEKKDGDGKPAEKTEKVEKVKEPVSTITVVTFKDLEEDLITKVAQVYQKYSSIENFDDKPEEVKKILQGAKELVPEEHHNKIPYIIFNAIFDVNIAKEVGKNKAILSQSYEEIKTVDSEFDTLLNLERFLLVRQPSHQFEKYIPTILKFFYDEELLSEEFLVSWDDGKLNSKLIMDFRYQKSIDDRFKTLAKPILNWLKEEEGGDEDGNGEKKEGEDEDSDIDIDNI